MAYHVQTDTYNGPLDLLVSLAHRGQVDLKTLPLRPIAEAYAARVRDEFPLDEATEVLVQLAVLADLKVRTLVPNAPPAEDTAEEETGPSDVRGRLDAQMARYLKFREAAQALRVLEEIQSNVFSRPPDAPDPTGDVLVDGITLQDLFAAFAQVLRRAKDAPREIAGEEFTVEQKMSVLLDLLSRDAGPIAFRDLFREGASRLEMIVTFLAVLELIKLRRIRVRQPQMFGEIVVGTVSAS